MKKRLLYVMFFIGIASQLWMGHAVGAGKVQGKERTGSPVADGTCGNCHVGGNYNTITTLSLVDANGTLVSKYKSGQAYTLKINVTGASSNGGSAATLFGFQGVALNNTNSSTGTFTLPSIVQTVKIGGRDIIEHKTPKGVGNWEVTWTAPAKNTGPVKFYFCGNACNGANGSSGDKAATAVLTLEEATSTKENKADGFEIVNTIVNDDFLAVKLNIEKSAKYNFTIFSLNGSTEISKELWLNTGESLNEYNISQLPQGIYLINISNGEEMITRKFFKN